MYSEEINTRHIIRNNPKNILEIYRIKNEIFKLIFL